MKLYGLIGKNISYSFSKKYFTDFFNENNIDASYENLDIDNLDNIKNIILEKKFSGLNVTIPYKEEILNYVDEVSNEVLKIGACNTLKIINNKIIAHNTDTFGFKESIKDFLPKINSALILGTGGASKAIEWVLKKENINTTFVSRNNIGSNIISYENIDLNEYDIIINTTPLGTFPNINVCPNIPYETLKKKPIFYDLIYNPSETLFLKRGKKKNVIIKNGKKMLIFQAKKSWEIWNKIKFEYF